MSDQYVPDSDVRRVIVQDARGGITSVREDAVPKGSKIIALDVEPGISEPYLERTVSEVVNPEPTQAKVEAQEKEQAEAKAKEEADAAAAAEAEAEAKKNARKK